LPNFAFVTDLHGSTDRYKKLFEYIKTRQPDAVFNGGDLLPHAMHRKAFGGESDQDFVQDFLAREFARLKESMGDDYPRVFIIFGNDDPRSEETAIEGAARTGIWEYMHCRWSNIGDYRVYGYAHVPPTPFQLKDWDRYDVSRYVDPGCISPEAGRRSVSVPEREIKFSTIKKDLASLPADDAFDNAIFLFHSPPYKTGLDRAGLDGKMIDHVPLDVHVGSIAIKEFIEQRQPLITLHGHIHESTRLTGRWMEQIGRTYAFSAAHDGSELAVVTFDPSDPQSAIRELL